MVIVWLPRKTQHNLPRLTAQTDCMNICCVHIRVNTTCSTRLLFLLIKFIAVCMGLLFKKKQMIYQGRRINWDTFSPFRHF